MFAANARLASWALLLPLAVSCTLHPTIYKDSTGRDVASLGASLWTRSKSQTLAITRPDGTRIESRSEGSDETESVKLWGNLQLAKQAKPLAEMATEVAK
jgi:hypothetical protein